jgi:regulator of replication initiation timing
MSAPSDVSETPHSSDEPDAPSRFNIRRLGQKKLIVFGGAALLVITILVIVLMLVFSSGDKKPVEPEIAPATAKKIKDLTRENVTLKQELKKSQEDYDALAIEHEKEKAKAKEAAQKPAPVSSANTQAAKKKAADEDMSNVAEALKDIKSLKLDH